MVTESIIERGQIKPIIKRGERHTEMVKDKGHNSVWGGGNQKETSRMC
jgi:hypothetical protein